jgi:hypothetical protein
LLGATDYSFVGVGINPIANDVPSSSLENVIPHTVGARYVRFIAWLLSTHVHERRHGVMANLMCVALMRMMLCEMSDEVLCACECPVHHLCVPVSSIGPRHNSRWTLRLLVDY